MYLKKHTVFKLHTYLSLQNELIENEFVIDIVSHSYDFIQKCYILYISCILLIIILITIRLIRPVNYRE